MKAMLSFTSACCALLLIGCGAASFPLQVPAPTPGPAQGLTILLMRDPNSQAGIDLDTTHFGDALEQALTRAGFVVKRGHKRASDPFDLVVAYARSMPAGGPGDAVGVWAITLSTEGVEYVDDANMFSIAGRYRATHVASDASDVAPVQVDRAANDRARNARAAAFSSGDDAPTDARGSRDGSADGGRSSFLGPLSTCFAAWSASAVSKGPPGTFATSTGSYEMAVNGPRPGETPPDTDARAASFLVNKLLACPGFADLAERMQDSGVATTTPMEKLPTAALLSACRSSEDAYRTATSDAVLRGTGLVRTMDDACDIVVQRDQRLASIVQGVRQKRAANRAAYWASDAPGAAEQARKDEREEHKQEAAERATSEAQRDQRDEQLRQQHDAAMQQIPGAVQQAVASAQAAIAPMPTFHPTTPQPSTHAANPGTTPSAGSATIQGGAGATSGAVAAQAALDQCLAQPVTSARTARTNSFLAHAQVFQSLLQLAQQTCAGSKSWTAWQSCLGDNATGALWSVEDQAVANQADLARRYQAVVSYYSASAQVCLWGHIKGTRSDCTIPAGSLEVVRNLCTTRLQGDIDQMNCDYAMLPGVWSAENARNDADTRKKHDDDCHAHYHP